MDDAGESLVYILLSFHGTDIDRPCVNRSLCLGHEVFSIDYVEYEECIRCDVQIKSTQQNESTYRLYVQELLEQSGEQERIT